MKPYLFILPLVAVIAANQAFAQQEETSEPLVIDSAVDFAEANVDRTIIHDGINNAVSAVRVVGDASYTGTDVNLSISFTLNEPDSIYGIRLDNGKSVNLKTSGEGVWNTITVLGLNSYGISLMGASEVSRISNTEINVTGRQAYGILANSGSSVELDNVNVHMSSLPDNPGTFGYGVYSGGGSRITNEGKGQVTIISDFTGGDTMINTAVVAVGGTVDFHDATISVVQTALPTAAVPNGVLSALSSTSASSIFLKNSNISSTTGNVFALIVGGAFLSTVDLDGVNLDNAKNQAIIHFGASLLNLSNGTNLDGYLKEYAAGSDFALAISSGASWNVTQDSTTGTTGSLSLGADSTISFVELSEGTFTNITSASIALEAGAILMLGATAEEILALIDNNGGSYDVNLFVTEEEFSNDGVVLVTSDGQEIEYTTDNLGNYTLKSILFTSIPEPTTGALWLSAFGLFAFRRMKN